MFSPDFSAGHIGVFVLRLLGGKATNAKVSQHRDPQRHGDMFPNSGAIISIDLL